MTTVNTVIEYNCASSNIVYPNFGSEDSEWKMLVEVDQKYVRQALRKSGCANNPYINNKYLVELDTFQGLQLFYQHDDKTWLVQRR